MDWLDILFGDLVLAIVVKDGQFFSVIIWQLLRDGSSCVVGEMTPFHKTEAPRRTSLNVVDLHITYDLISLEPNGDCRDTSMCCSLVSCPPPNFIL